LNGLGEAMLKGFSGGALKGALSTALEPFFKRATYDQDAEMASVGEVLYQTLIGGLSDMLSTGAAYLGSKVTDTISGNKISKNQQQVNDIITSAQNLTANSGDVVVNEVLKSIKDVLKELLDSIEELQNKVTALETENAAIRTELANTKNELRSLIDELTTEFNAIEKQISDLSTSVTKLKSDLTQAKNDLSTLNKNFKQISDISTKLETLSKKVSNLTAAGGDITVLKEQVNKLQNDLTNVLAELGKVYETVFVPYGATIFAKDADDTVMLILRTGSAVAVSPYIQIGTIQGLNNLTNGTDICDGEQIPLYHNIMIPRGGDDGRGVTVTSIDGAYFLLGGDYTIVEP
jgi:prefoldin subunit 5